MTVKKQTKTASLQLLVVPIKKPFFKQERQVSFISNSLEQNRIFLFPTICTKCMRNNLTVQHKAAAL